MDSGRDNEGEDLEALSDDKIGIIEVTVLEQRVMTGRGG